MGLKSTSATITGSLPKVLLLANDPASAHAIREGIRRAGLTLILETVASRSEFVLRLRSGQVDLVLAAASVPGGLPLSEIIEEEAGTLIPLIVIGDQIEEYKPLRSVDSLVRDYVPANELLKLPARIERVLRDRRLADKRDPGRAELERAAEHLRENQRLLTLGRLTASIVHEINNPLESLTNLLYLMETEQGSREKRVEYLKVAQRELNRVVQISKQTLSFSRETKMPVHLQIAELI